MSKFIEGLIYFVLLAAFAAAGFVIGTFLISAVVP